MREDLETYLDEKTHFIYRKEISRSYIKYKFGDILVPPDPNYRYFILGFLESDKGYLRYVGELTYKFGNNEITSRGIADIQKDYKLSISHILKKL